MRDGHFTQLMATTAIIVTAISPAERSPLKKRQVEEQRFITAFRLAEAAVQQQDVEQLKKLVC